MVGGSTIGIVGISGGQTALACDIAEARGIGVAEFSVDDEGSCLCKALPGTSGSNPVDFGATVNVEDRKPSDAIAGGLGR